MKRSKHQKPVKILSREMKVKQYKDVPPSQIFYNPHTIKWFRHRYNEDLIKKSIYSLFPNNCAPMMTEEENTPMRILMEWLSHYLKPESKYKDIWINPKYFFTKSTYNKILKLKEIFLQFDEDGSRKMEIDEMVTMFRTNHIEVTEDDLCSLFFKGKKFRKEDINKLYLDFYQFMQFALSKASDQDFRLFMRKIKEKIMKEREEQEKEEQKKSNKNVLMGVLDEKNDEDDPLDPDGKNEPIFLPMNFNLVLDYFINKGKERKSQKKIRKAIKMMKNILKPGTYPDNDKDFLPSEGEDDDGDKGSKKSFSDSSDESEEEKKKEDEYDKQLKEINTEQIMEEFEKLFHMSYTATDTLEKDRRKKKNIYNRSTTLASNPKFSIGNLRMSQTNHERSKNRAATQLGPRMSFGTLTKGDESLNESIKKLKEEISESNANITEESTEPSMIFSSVLRRKLDEQSIGQKKEENYARFHSVKLAKAETKKYINDLTRTNTQSGFRTTTYLPKIADNRKYKGFFQKKNKTRFLY